MSNHWRRRSLRLVEYDYAQSGAYFVTIVTQRRLSLFGSVVDGDMQLNEAGRMVGSVWCRLSERFPSITLDEFIVMPNHVHGLLFVEAREDHVGAPLVDALPAPEGGGGIRRPSLGEIVGAYKSHSTVEYIRAVKDSGWRSFEGRLWQRNFYEHVVRDEQSLDQIREYIVGNPAMWESDRENLEVSQATGGRPQGSPLQEPWRV